MRQYQVLISDKAHEDMEALYRYIAETLLEPDTAAQQYDKIADAILSLEEMPERIRMLDFEPLRSKGLRPLLVGKYTVFFVIHDETVLVARVLYSASDIRTRISEE